MRRFRMRRKRALAFALVPVAALSIGSTTSSAQETTVRQAAIDSGKDSVRFGDRVRLHGRFPGAPGADVSVEYRGARADNFKRVTTTRTGAEERWSVRVRPRRSGVWRARLIGAQRAADGSALLGESATPVDSESDAQRVRVRSVTDVDVSRRHAVSGRTVHIDGRVLPAGTRRKVVVRIDGREIVTRAGRDGRFDVNWRTGATGTYRVRARARGNVDAAGSRAGAGRVTVYRYASASWYGPGLYGNRTACGQTLTSSTMGVAHKSMPCGTRLKLRHSGNTVTVRVIDRGPYVAGREFDLTEATKNALGFGSTGNVLSSK